MAKKKKIFRWKCAALTLLLGAALCTAGCGKEDTSKKEEVAKQEKLVDTQTKKVENSSAEAPENAPTETPENTPTEASVSTPEPTPTEIPGIEFPYEVDGGRLVIESLFQLSSINPDCNDEMGEDVASLQIENASDEYLKSADIQVLLHDGTEFKFHMEDVPAGKKVLAFELENQVYDKKSGVKDITVEAEYSAEASLMEGQVSASVDEAGLKLENTSGEALQNLTVKYHCLFEEMYYGGRSYAKTIESLAPGESTVVDTSECYLGEAAVVSISK